MTALPKINRVYFIDGDCKADVGDGETVDLLNKGETSFVSCGDLDNALLQDINPRQFFRCFQQFKENGYLSWNSAALPKDEKELLFHFAKTCPTTVLDNADKFQPDEDEVIEVAVRTAIESDGGEDADEGCGLAERDEERNIPLRYAALYAHRPYAAGMIYRIAEGDPGAALDYADHYSNQPYATEVIERAAWADPVTAVTSEKGLSRIDVMVLHQKRVPFFKTLLDIINSPYSDADKARMALLTEEIVSGGLTVRQAYQLGQDPKTLFNRLVKIKSIPNHIGSTSIDNALEAIALQVVEEINLAHNLSEKERFKTLGDYDEAGLYFLMVYAENEMFTSSFNGIFDRLMAAFEKDHVSGYTLLVAASWQRFRTFIKLCAVYNRLNEFLYSMRRELASTVLIKFASDIEKAPDMLSEAVTVADMLGSIANQNVLDVLQRTVRAERRRVQRQGHAEAEVIYGLLADIAGSGHTNMCAATTYRLPELTMIPSHQLFGPDGTNIQQHFFYDDADGAASFKNFIMQYQDDRRWTIRDHDLYVSIISDKMNGRRIEMYANKPEKGEATPGLGDLDDRFGPRVIVHRGHSYHANDTIDHMPSAASIVFLGSCGGYNDVADVLKNIPDAHIIATKATGTMRVNDALLKMLNDEILEGKDIYWPDFWKKAQDRLGYISEFSNYVPPHANLGVKFLKAFFEYRRPRT